MHDMRPNIVKREVLQLCHAVSDTPVLALGYFSPGLPSFLLLVEAGVW